MPSGGVPPTPQRTFRVTLEDSQVPPQVKHSLLDLDLDLDPIRTAQCCRRCSAASRPNPPICPLLRLFPSPGSIQVIVPPASCSPPHHTHSPFIPRASESTRCDPASGRCRSIPTTPHTPPYPTLDDAIQQVLSQLELAARLLISKFPNTRSVGRSGATAGTTSWEALTPSIPHTNTRIRRSWKCGNVEVCPTYPHLYVCLCV